LVLTQNVDRYHIEAGSSNVIDIHGDIWIVKCLQCGFIEDSEKQAYEEIPPKCSKCDGILRPEVVLFNEMLDERKILNLQDQFSRGFDIICAVGTTAVFPYIQQPVIVGKKSGAFTVEINPTDTLLSSYVDSKISLGAAKALTDIWDLLDT
jgi:NAD-dependent deacetylase